MKIFFNDSWNFKGIFVIFPFFILLLCSEEKENPNFF